MELKLCILCEPEVPLRNTAKRDSGMCAPGHVDKNVCWGIFVVTPSKKQFKCPPIVERINEFSYNHTMEYCTGLKMSKVQLHTTIWIKATNTILIKTSIKFQKSLLCLYQV